MKVLGIDEAGKGCVIGPMIIAGVLIEISKINKLKLIGVKDSKTLSSVKREKYLKEILKVSDKVKLIKVLPSEIDRRNMNDIEIEKSIELINILRPDIVYLDVPTHPNGIKKYCNRIKSGITFRVNIVGENKADKKYSIVSAASIAAKVRRDKSIAHIRKKYGNLGSGYPSDKITRAFLESKSKDIDKFIRKKWKTIHNLSQTALF